MYSPEERRLLRKLKFSPILSRSGSSLAISSISGRALASLSVNTRDNGKPVQSKSYIMMHNCTNTLERKCKELLSMFYRDQGQEGQALAHLFES